MIYFKSIFTNEFELDQIYNSINELKDIIDCAILIEPSFRHNGEPKNLVGLNSILPKIHNLQVHYMVVPRLDFITTTKESKRHHLYERITRGYFVKGLKLKDDDIIISVDADEFLYSNVIIDIINKLKSKCKYSKGYKLKLHQFFYKPYWKAIDHDFIAPSVSYYGSRYLQKNYWLGKYNLVDWRYSGKLHEEHAGVHLSWFNTKEELLTKVKTWSHSSEFNLSDNEILSKLNEDINFGRYSFRHPPLKLEKVEAKDFLPTSLNI
jgi:hypothetical protein